MLKHFDTESRQLEAKLITMAELTEKMISLVIKALIERDISIAQEIFNIEQEVNTSQIVVDDEVVKLLALYQPMAEDLRFLIVASKITAELERIADLSINIYQNAQVYLKYPPLKPLIDIPRMADISRKMVRDSLQAYVTKDAELARKVLLEDDTVDGLKEQIFRELLTYMMSDPATIQRALCLILISRNLERMADHATNIAEDVIYLVQGKEVRHHWEEKERIKTK